ncbi:hypothetical protein HJC23_003996 [Cyclotella cryptica]|uniref:tRNA pseudouridine synthase n=1 Tax=Cyclotella cryptica TaxID=29204 RepID=A0ABD3QVA4_9STRA|eukprot:CCRYP_001980-RA/>CCRYP_001980-RA protein AED:0.09 eAED:0.09 QI:0/-1/0/1/-1/1/1/0/442
MLSRNWRRYAFAVQYHGGSSLGFTYQGPKGENCIVYQPGSDNTVIQADLRGFESVEGRIRRALNRLVGSDNYKNIQVSSRTDRGVHAWRNTFQVDIRSRRLRCPSEAAIIPEKSDRNLTSKQWNPRNLVHGLNFYLARLPSFLLEDEPYAETRNDVSRLSTSENQRFGQTFDYNSNIRILSAGFAPNIRVPNRSYDPNLPEDAENNPKDLEWDVRFTATKRTYAYQILHSFDPVGDGDNDCQHLYSTASYHFYPFLHDKVWRIHEKRSKRHHAKYSSNLNPTTTSSLDIEAMNRAGKYLIGTHDFTSFRGKGCQRASPVVTIDDLWCAAENYRGDLGGGILNAVSKKLTFCTNQNEDVSPHLDTMLRIPDALQLITIVISGNSFLYHQVRNVAACLVEVGRGKMNPEDVKSILDKRNRACAPGMAPPQGLFLVDVEHGDFRF